MSCDIDKHYDVIVEGYNDKGEQCCRFRYWLGEMPKLGELAKDMPETVIRMTVDVALPLVKTKPKHFGRKTNA